MKTGVIGLGAMGTPMALNLYRAGHLCAVWNRTPTQAEALSAKTGGLVAQTPAQLAACSDLILISVSRDSDLLEVIEALLPAILPSRVVADTSTVSADTARAVAEKLRERRAEFLDCPVSGGVEGARKRTPFGHRGYHCAYRPNRQRSGDQGRKPDHGRRHQSGSH
jgi:3-hydroxyisobutyrate dehydrogenase